MKHLLKVSGGFKILATSGKKTFHCYNTCEKIGGKVTYKRKVPVKTKKRGKNMSIFSSTIVSINDNASCNVVPLGNESFN